ncbi:MAG: LysR family transcriptional regulator [Chloroflexi bacterium]|nr:LysR family transcriptional regulator [Chloroflexota bacterium]
MNLNQLLYFFAVARTGNFSRASEELGVSQPAVYKSVKSLENTCGIKLLERQGKGMVLTKAGRSLYECAEEIAALENVAERVVAAEKEPMVGHISIATGTNVGCYLLPNILSKWMSEHPRVTLTIIHGEHDQMESLLLRERVDFVLGSGERWAPGLQSELIFSDALVVAAAAGHPLESAGFIPLKQLNRELFIVPLKGSASREELNLIQSQYGVRFRIAMEVNRHDMIKHLCAKGIGIGVLPRAIITEEVKRGEMCILNVEGFPRSRRCFLVQRRGSVLSAEMRSLLASVQIWAREQGRGK